MGCSGSRQRFEEIGTSNDPNLAMKRVRVVNYQIESGTVYSGDMIDRMRDGEGTQICMLLPFSFPIVLM